MRNAWPGTGGGENLCSLARLPEPNVRGIGAKVFSGHHVSVRGKIVEDLLSYCGVCFNADQLRLKPLDRKALQNHRLVQFNIHRQKVDVGDATPLEDVVEAQGVDLQCLYPFSAWRSTTPLDD